MDTNPEDDHAALTRLADALVEDILTLPDAEILAEFAESDGDPEAYAAQMRAHFAQIAARAPQQE